MTEVSSLKNEVRNKRFDKLFEGNIIVIYLFHINYIPENIHSASRNKLFLFKHIFTIVLGLLDFFVIYDFERIL